MAKCMLQMFKCCDITGKRFILKRSLGATLSQGNNIFRANSTPVGQMNPFMTAKNLSQVSIMKPHRQNELSYWGIQKSNTIHTSNNRKIMEDTDTKALTVWSSVKAVRSSPVPALTLGFSGLSLFLAGPLYMLYTHSFDAYLAYAQVAYGASILSFIGGVRWGFTIPEENPINPDWKNLGYSVMPSLFAWSGLLMPHPFSLLTVMVGLVGAGYFDIAMYGYPPWFKGLRFILTFVATLSLWTTLMIQILQ